MEHDKDCIFCKVVKGELPSTKVYDDDNFIGILDINPSAEGETLIICKKHYKTLLDMPSSLGNEMIEGAKEIALKLIKQEKAEGFNLMNSNFEVAGQEVNHVHFYIIPRKKADGIKLVVNLKKIAELD